MYKFILFAASAALASAFTTPTTQCTDSCNPIAKPGLNEVVPAGTAYTITWQPTTAGTVSIVLLKGPSTNILPLYAVAESIANTGTYSWTPAADLQPTGDSGYGFQLINDADGTFQYSTQFGISNGGYSPAVSSSAAGSPQQSSGPTGPIAGGAVMNNRTTTDTGAPQITTTPIGYSNNTAIVTSTATDGNSNAASSTLTRVTGSGASGSATRSSAVVASTNAAVAVGAFSIAGTFAAVMAAVAVL